MHYFGPENREEEASSTFHVADQWHTHPHQSHAHGPAHHNEHHSVDIECPLDGADSDGETDSTADDDQLNIGRKRQIIGILVRHFSIT